MDGANEGPINHAVAGVLYDNDRAALHAVNGRYHYWTERLTDSSFQLSLAIIGVNWAVFGTVDKILHNLWAEGSIAVVLLGLGINLIGTKVLGELLRKRVDYAEADLDRWAAEFRSALGSANAWPFTRAINGWARALRECKTWSPILGGCFLVVALTASDFRPPPGAQISAIALRNAA